MCGCAGWSASLLFAYGKSRFCYDVAHIIPIVAISEIPRRLLASVTEQAGLSLAGFSWHGSVIMYGESENETAGIFLLFICTFFLTAE